MNAKAALILSVACLILLASGILDPIERVSLDWRFRYTPRPPLSPSLCVIELDQKSCAEIGQWPWPRSRYASLLHALKAAGARIVALDILLPDRSNDRDDQELANAIEKSGNVYLPIVLSDYSPKQRESEIIVPLPQFSARAKGLGFVNFYSDPDGVNRSIPLVIRRGDEIYPQFAFAVACDLLGVRENEVLIREGKDAILRTRPGTGVRIPLSQGSSTVINWAGRWDNSFPRYSYVDVMKAFRESMPGKPLPHPLSQLKDKICFVGLTAPGTFDSQPVPVEANYPNLGLHVNLLNSILVNRFITHAGKKWEALFIVLIIFFMCVLIPNLQPLRALGASLALLGGIVAVTYGLFFAKGVWVEATCLIACVPICYTTLTTIAWISASRDRTRLWSLANTDPLTGAYLMRYFNERVKTELEHTRGGNGKVSLLIANLDNLKTINDNYGTSHGDFVLQETTRLINRMLDRDSIMARYQEDSFIILAGDAGGAGLTSVAERLRESIASHRFLLNGSAHSLTVSIGVATAAGETAAKLILRADEAAFEAKERGGNRVCYSRGEDENSHRR